MSGEKSHWYKSAMSFLAGVAVGLLTGYHLTRPLSSPPSRREKLCSPKRQRPYLSFPSLTPEELESKEPDGEIVVNRGTRFVAIVQRSAPLSPVVERVERTETVEGGGEETKVEKNTSPSSSTTGYASAKPRKPLVTGEPPPLIDDSETDSVASSPRNHAPSPQTYEGVAFFENNIRQEIDALQEEEEEAGDDATQELREGERAGTPRTPGTPELEEEVDIQEETDQQVEDDEGGGGETEGTGETGAEEVANDMMTALFATE